MQPSASTLSRCARIPPLFCEVAREAPRYESGQEFNRYWCFNRRPMSVSIGGPRDVSIGGRGGRGQRRPPCHNPMVFRPAQHEYVVSGFGVLLAVQFVSHLPGVRGRGRIARQVDLRLGQAAVADSRHPQKRGITFNGRGAALAGQPELGSADDHCRMEAAIESRWNIRSRPFQPGLIDPLEQEANLKLVVFRCIDSHRKSSLQANTLSRLTAAQCTKTALRRYRWS